MWKTISITMWISIYIDSSVDINSFFMYFFKTFPRFLAEKRYKLSNFAPK